ncbi:MAG: hypothetical protein CSB48_07080 [Proteobacteria bacterium]|nr:MAG: hypothetical protein CSB48_07080 [Pseudomonadota bacterium]PIE40143.1 MAG: hypothetical protein CSA51_01890 [Gammaproteobacteria bacterium]
MSNIPGYLQDAQTLLTKHGFTTSDVWYHGTSSALVHSIKEQGLKRSGDRAIKQAAKKTMATIGNHYTESIEPVFLTQSKELAWYWAQQTVRNRMVRFEETETPVVLAVKLPEELLSEVKPDVGARSLLLLPEGEHYLARLAIIAERCGIEPPAIDLMKADRMEFLNTLGMAYIDRDIPAECIEEIKA